PCQMRLHGRPLAGNDAVDAGIAQRSIVCDLMAAQDAVQLCAQPLDSAAALLIEEMGAKFHRDAMERVKGVLKKQKLALRIELRPLNAFPVPRAANLHAAMVRLSIQIIRHPYGLACCVIDNGKRNPSTFRLAGESAIDELDELVRRRNRRVPQLPKLSVVQRLDEIV